MRVTEGEEVYFSRITVGGYAFTGTRRVAPIVSGTGGCISG